MVLYVRQVMVKKYFHEVIEEEEKILAIGLKQSRLHKKERLDREKNKEKTLHELLMEGFEEEQEQRRLEELEEEKTPSEKLQDELEPIDD
tara:strand:+ start:114 stop:383 length:270 start_codon:yes stop_codon:yes gene_type:complete